jgi:hypothetical protein
MNISFVVGHGRASSFVSVYRVYSASVVNISERICEVQSAT